MTQFIVAKNNDGLIMAADSKGFDFDLNGTEKSCLNWTGKKSAQPSQCPGLWDLNMAWPLRLLKGHHLKSSPT